jgi:hypothetical protein
LPAQLGRMWGILGSKSDQQKNERSKSVGADAFLVLEPAGGAHLLETERSPGGVLPLSLQDGRKLVVLRCGRHSPPCDEAGCCRLAARLCLPAWAHAPLESSALQRPLLRSTWIWRDGNGTVNAASDVLRAIQVPSLLIEAKVGLPLRIVLAADSNDCETFDSGRFLDALSSALGVDKGRLSLGRLSPGSIIADLQLLDADATDITRLNSVCTMSKEVVGEALAQRGFNTATGFSSADLTIPGGQAVRRVLQWRLAAALEAAATGSPGSRCT